MFWLKSILLNEKIIVFSPEFVDSKLGHIREELAELAHILLERVFYL